MKQIIIASANKGKIREFQQILGAKYQVLSMADVGVSDEIEENGLTFEDNATIKAKFVYEKTGLPTIADDSGLCVPSLGGAPGIYSARYAGEKASMEENKRLLLKNLQGKNRYAYFVCCLVYYDGEKIVVEGKTEGEILFEQKGTNGFGYDDLFYSLDLSKSFAECTDQEKNAVSHRSRAIEKMCEELKRIKK